MAIWNGTPLNNARLAGTIHQLHKSNKLIDTLRKSNDFINVIMGEAIPRTGQDMGVDFQRVKRTGGQGYKARLLGNDIAPDILPRGAAELATSTPAIFDGFGGATIQTAPYHKKQYVPGSDIDDIEGKPESQGVQLAVDYYKAFMKGELRKLDADALSDASGPSGTALGGARFMVSDGLNVGGVDETAKAQFLVNRADSANAFARGQVKRGLGTLTWQAIGGQQVIGEVAGDTQFDLGVWSPAAYAKLKTQIESLTQITYDAKMTKLGARHFFYSGMANVADGNMPDSEALLLTTDTWTLYMDLVKKVTDGFQQDTSRDYAWFLLLRFYASLFCENPAANMKLMGLVV